ncbi:proton-conducting transporter membrane subunit [Flexivirga alba]|uniref:Proton-conducting transporter membrane subunit n=1 Tax=Flexivirga alba TaxID=702742 RepID=A0ABW2AJ05_9MICO
MTGCLIALLLIPLAAAGLSATLRGWAGHAVTIAAGLASCALVASMWTSVGRGAIGVGFLRVDAVSMVFLLGTSFLYAVVAVYTAGYLRAELAQRTPRAGLRYQRRFLLGINLFVWAMLFAPSVNGLALVWVGVEVTTIVSAVLVAIDDTEAAAEAAWKYVLIASCGLGIALLATIFMYYAGAQVLGESYDLSFPQLLAHAGQLPATPVRLAFVLAVIGFGTKVGLFPVHTWLPDAHAEAPTPLSALLSGSLLAVSFYAILRFYQVTAAAVGAGFAGGVLLVFGVLTLLLAALYLLDQRNLKRLLAYSSVEHMGILAIGVSFGNPIALFGVMLHVLVHAAGKGGAFLSAGAIVQGFGTKRLARIHGAFERMPWTASVFVIAIFALCGMPPFGIFRSEFLVIQGGFSAHHTASAALLVVLVTGAFIGLAATTTRSVASGPADATSTRHEANALMVVPAVACVLALLLIGVWVPGPVATVLHNAAFELTGGGHGAG